MRRELLAELLELPPAERLELAEHLWDSLDADDLPPLTDDQVAELRRRIAEYRRDPSKGAPWEEVRERLWARYR